MDLKTNQPELYDFLSKNLVYSSVVTEEERQRQMYEDYQQQMRSKGVEPAEFDRIVFLSSNMAHRDDDLDFSPSDVRKEAKYAWGFMMKIKGLKLDTIVMSIGYEPALYVEGTSTVRER